MNNKRFKANSESKNKTMEKVLVFVLFLPYLFIVVFFPGCTWTCRELEEAKKQNKTLVQSGRAWGKKWKEDFGKTARRIHSGGVSCAFTHNMIETISFHSHF